MALSDLLPGFLGGDDSSADSTTANSEAEADSVVFECRNCGKTVDRQTTTCPTCGSTEIVEYPIE